MSGDPQTQLDRIEGKVDRVEAHLRKLNGKVARHEQTLYGIDGRDGMVTDVRDLKSTVRPAGTVQIRTMWAAIGALAAVASVMAALVIGLT